MTDLGIINYTFKIEQTPDGKAFSYRVAFNLEHTGRFYGTTGKMPTWDECIGVMRQYVAGIVREAMAG